MSAPLDELYFEWLYGQVGSVKRTNPSATYWKLLKLLFTKEFVWIVPNDDNRIEDGKDLRYEFLAECEIDTEDRDWLELGCSFLELLIGLSRRLAFEADGLASDWFWELIDNLGLRSYNDRANIPENHVDETLNRVIFRTFNYDGTGGLFPLKEATQDQRDVEIWYQLSAYLTEREF